METWDKLYLKLTELVQHKNHTTQVLWSLAFSAGHSHIKIAILNCWKNQVLHTIGLSKLLQNLGYTQLKITLKGNEKYADIYIKLQEIVEEKESLLPIIEKLTEECFGNDIYYTLLQIMADDLVNIEVLKELQNSLVNNNLARDTNY